MAHCLILVFSPMWHLLQTSTWFWLLFHFNASKWGFSRTPTALLLLSTEHDYYVPFSKVLVMINYSVHGNYSLYAILTLKLIAHVDYSLLFLRFKTTKIHLWDQTLKISISPPPMWFVPLLTYVHFAATYCSKDSRNA